MPSDSLSALHQTMDMDRRYNCYGEEIVRRDSIGSYDAYRELQELSSVQLLRDSILQSISRNNSSVQTRYGHREEISSPSQPCIEVKFLEKRCSSFSSPKPQSREAKPPQQTSKAESPEKNESKYPPLPDFEISGSFEASGEFFKEKNDKEAGGLKSIDESTDDTPPKPGNSGKNSLKLAIRSKSDSIFEDCSTYNISCPDASPEFKSNEIFTNSIAGSYSDVASTDLENSLETNYSFSDSELAFSRSANSPDEQTSLCDTFFTHFNSENGQLPKSQSPPLSNRKASTSEQRTGSNSQTQKEEGAKKSEGVVEELHHGRRRNSKKLRRRHRKSHSKDPFVYECPRCGVSYVIASKMANDGVCLHCDMWTSVEPEFVKREKLMTWNTCRIC